jgi:hypothetical protein
MAEQVLPRSGGGRGTERAKGRQTMYTHVSKCKNNKKKNTEVAQTLDLTNTLKYKYIQGFQNVVLMSKQRNGNSNKDQIKIMESGLNITEMKN